MRLIRRIYEWGNRPATINDYVSIMFYTFIAIVIALGVLSRWI